MRTTKTKGFKIKVEGLPDNKSITYKYFVTGDENVETRLFSIQSDGIYSLPDGEATTDTIAAGFYTSDKTLDGYMGLTITQLPSAYEGALVFDGVDDYGICVGFPIMTDYTVICRREIINKYYAVASKSKVTGEGAFIFEIIANKINFCYSFGNSNEINLYNGEISWQTKKSYNGNMIKMGDRKDNDTLTLGIVRERDGRHLKGAIYYFALYNKSLTIEEIETEKERLNEEWLKRKN